MCVPSDRFETGVYDDIPVPPTVAHEPSPSSWYRISVASAGTVQLHVGLGLLVGVVPDTGGGSGGVVSTVISFIPLPDQLPAMSLA